MKDRIAVDAVETRSAHITPLIVNCFGLIAGAYTLLHDIFIVYHVDAFLNGFAISPLSFTVSEIVFLIWNTLNDPLFGYLSDREILTRSMSLVGIVHKRCKLIIYSSMLFCVSFAFIWQNSLLFSYPGIRFGVSLCLYDTALTMLNLQHDSLLADLAITQHDRSVLGSRSSLFQCIGAIGVVLLSYISPTASVPGQSGLDPNFTVFCYFISIVVLLLLLFSTTQIKNIFQDSAEAQELVKLKIKPNPKTIEVIPTLIESKQEKPISKNCNTSTFRMLFLMMRRPNFVWFSVLYFLQVFHCHFNSNFFPLFSRYLLGQDQQALISALVAMSFMMPHLNNMLLLNLAQDIGLYWVVMGLLLAKVGMALVTFVCGYQSLFFISVFIASNRMFTEGVCKLLAQVISDLVDEDMVLSGRKSPVSALVFGCAALVSRPGQTVAPIFGIMVLHCLAGVSYSAVSSQSGMSILDHASDVSWDIMETSCFILSTLVAIVTGTMQLFAWSQYKLHGSYLAYIKQKRQAI
ncbi:hypothetical protein Ciccas_005485 [Cichlidogyrus casuarinus]|uniref:Transmembrane protein 180 n=1 Tax=Cichlidogyrus casuarinus TaxID=1844966 RepID=A0ABD2Q8K2_9PLAT